MDFKNKEIIFNRFNEAVYDLALSIIEKRKEGKHHIKHKRDAGEAISQTIEYALKNHLQKNISVVGQRNVKKKESIFDLVRRYVDGQGNPSLLYNKTVSSTIPSVDFNFLVHKKKDLTNASKHEGKEPELNIQKKYLEEVRKFIYEYIDNEVKLKTISDFENADLSTWDLFYSACDRFKKDERTYILIVGQNQHLDKNYLEKLAINPWDLIIDFDYESQNNGFFKWAFKDTRLTPHIYKAGDLVDSSSFSNYSQNHYHLFANNFKGSGEIEPKDYKDWNRNFANHIEHFIKSFASVFLNQKTIVVALYDSRRHVNFLCEKIDRYFGASTSFVFANDPNDELQQVSEDFEGTRVNITIPEIASGLESCSSNFGIRDNREGEYQVPFLVSSETKDVTGLLTQEQFITLEEDFEVVHKGLPDYSETEEDRRSFLTGEGRISWFGLKHRFDVERQNFHRKYVKPIEKVIEKGRGMVFLRHDAGYGGTTVARRIAWEIHNDYPTLILKKFREKKVREKLINLHQQTRKTLFVVMEVPQSITLDEVSSLYSSIPPARPVVFLVVKRGQPRSNDLAVADWGNDTPDLVKVFKPFVNEYSDVNLQQKKKKALDELIYSQDTFKKTPFYVGLLTFEEKFLAIEDYVKNFIYTIQNKNEQKRVLIYLALLDNYLGQGLPANFFKKIFKIEDNPQQIFRLDDYFQRDTSIIDSLLISHKDGNQIFWNVRHVFLSRELKKQILSGSSENPEMWKQALADTCINLIEDSVSDAGTTEYIQEVLQQLFIGSRRERAGEDFTQIITDIESLDDKERVFIALKNSYPDNPHYCSHLARFYAYNNKNRDKALQYADEAIRLSEMQGFDDPLLYHIKGMCLRANAYEAISAHLRMKYNGHEIDQNDYEEVIYKLIPESAVEFQTSREKAFAQNRIDEYGYVAHIQLLIKGIDYGAAISGKSKTEFLSENNEPFAEWLDTAESLLEDVKRINRDKDESGKIEDCENEIAALYENFETILQSLRNRLDTGKNPTRTRRQIVRTYSRRSKDYVKDFKTIRNILDLMEANIDSEPDNEKNFYLWFQAARHSHVTLDEALSKMSKWKASSSTIDAIYYFYILKVIRALEGYSDASVDAFNLIKECKTRGRSNITPFEWLGKGNNLKKLINKNELDEENKDSKLQLVRGYFTDHIHEGSGTIIIADRLRVFVSPTQAKLTSSDLNKEVEFYLGFTYDGLRADSYSVRVVDGGRKYSNPNSTNIPPKSKNGRSKSSQSESQTRQLGIVVDLRYPPNYVMGDVETELGKRYFFHKDNENPEVFNALKIDSQVSFLLKKTKKGWLAYDIELLDE